MVYHVIRSAHTPAHGCTCIWYGQTEVRVLLVSANYIFFSTLIRNTTICAINGFQCTCTVSILLSLKKKVEVYYVHIS